MGRRAADHPTPVPVLGEPALVGTRVWRTMPFGTSSMATMTLVHHCNVGVQTSPKMRNQLQLDGKHTNEENITMQATKDPDINVDHRKEQTKSIIIKQRSLETKMKKGVTFEGLEKDFYKNIKNEKQHNNCSSLTLSAMANYMPKQKKSCFFTNGSVVDPEVMGGISSDISEGEEFSKGKKIPLPPRSPPERPPVMICSTCGGKQYPASAEIDNKTKKMAVSASAYSLGLQLRDSSPLYPGKDIQIESHNARSVTQSDLHPMSPNLHPYLSMNTNKEWPLSRLPAQQSGVSNLTNHHAVKRESSVDTNINQSSRSSALNAQTLTIPEKVDRGSFLNTHKAENSCPCIPPQIDSKTQGGSRTPQLKPTLQKTPNENPPTRNLLALCDCSYLQTENAHKEPPSVYRQNSAKQISKSQNGETFCKPLNRKNSFSTCFSLNAKHQTEQSSLNEGIISTLASNSQRQIRHPRELESNVDQQNKESLSSHTDLSTKTSSKTQIRVDKESKCSPSESQLDEQKLHNDTSHASMHTDTHSPAGTHKKDSNISKQHKNTTGNSLEGIPSQTDASTHLHLKVKSDKRLFSHTPNMSTHPKAKLTKPTLHNQNISNALISTQTQVEVHSHTKESSQTSPRVKPVSYNVCVHSKTQRQQTKPAVFRHSVLNQLNNDSLESSLPAIASVRAFPQTKMHRGTEFNQWSDIESKKQGIVKEAQPLLKTTNSLVEPPIKPPPLMSTGGQPPKPSSAPPQEPTFKHIIGENHPNSDNSRNLVEHMDCITGAETILSDPSSRKHDHPVSALQLLPASPYFGNRRDSKNKLEMVEASLQSNKDRVTTLLNIIQDLEMNHALSKGRRCFQTGQDLSDCSTCQKTACAVYSVEYEFRQQEGRFKELLHSLCPHTMERTEEYEESLLTSLIQNHKLHRLKANLMSQVKPENQAQTVCKNQCQIQTPNQNPVTKSQNQTRSETKIQSHSQIQLQPQTSFSSQSEILSQILPPFPIMSQIQPQNQAQTHSQNQCLFKAKIKRKKLCRKLFGWLPHRVYLK